MLRRDFLTSSLATLGFQTLFGTAFAGPKLATAYPMITRFDVFRNGVPLGLVVQKFQKLDRRLVVETAIDFKVDFIGFTIYRYEHRAQEVWINNKLHRLTSITNDSGTKHNVEGRRTNNYFSVSGDEGTLKVPLDIVPSSYWHPHFINQSHMLDSQRGLLLDISLTEIGEEQIETLGNKASAKRYRMSGDIRLDIWYDTEKVWQKMQFEIDDSLIDYTKVKPEPDDSHRFASALIDGRSLRFPKGHS